jgi:molecular chaperone DnaK
VGASPTTSAPAVVPPDEQCTDAIKKNPRWVCLTKATMTNSELRIEYDSENNGTKFNITNGFHLHVYGANADGSDPKDSSMGAQARNRGSWFVEDKQPSVHESGSNQYNSIRGYQKVCARIAKTGHELVPDTSGAGTFKTGNCVPLTLS